VKLWLLSDLHFEFHADGGLSFLASLPEPDYDLAVIAGDLCDYKTLRRSLQLVSARFKHVAYILGNHECYGGSIANAHLVAARMAQDLPNLTYLDCSYIDLGEGRKLHGHTLWFPYPNRENFRWEKGMNDFYQIADFRAEVGPENQRALRYLGANVHRGDVVVTHHLPIQQCIHSKYAGSPLNAYFVGGAKNVILEREPSLWMHGHGHDSCDFVFGATRFLRNPFGYSGHELNRNFNTGLVLEV
jgi:hypothetical protein